MELERTAPLMMQLYATDAAGVAKGQASIAQWCADKEIVLRGEVELAERSLETARSRKWSLKPHQSALLAAKRQLAFYQKIREAIEAGYVMIPDLPVTLFAVRTKRWYPQDTSLTYPGGVNDTAAQTLPSGEGRYVSPNVMVQTVTVKDKEGKDQQRQRATDLIEQIEFPVRFVRPEIIEATDQAMIQKIFDDIGYAGPIRGKGDPFVVGRIKRPTGGRWTPPVCFFIAWHFDLRTL